MVNDQNGAIQSLLHRSLARVIAQVDSLKLLVVGSLTKMVKGMVELIVFHNLIPKEVIIEEVSQMNFITVIMKLLYIVHYRIVVATLFAIAAVHRIVVAMVNKVIYSRVDGGKFLCMIEICNMIVALVIEGGVDRLHTRLGHIVETKMNVKGDPVIKLFGLNRKSLMDMAVSKRFWHNLRTVQCTMNGTAPTR